MKCWVMMAHVFHFNLSPVRAALGSRRKGARSGCTNAAWSVVPSGTQFKIGPGAIVPSISMLGYPYAGPTGLSLLDQPAQKYVYFFSVNSTEACVSSQAMRMVQAPPVWSNETVKFSTGPEVWLTDIGTCASSSDSYL